MEQEAHRSRPPRDQAISVALFARMDGAATAVALGAVLALLLFAGTGTLLIRGAIDGGPVGPNLAALGTYLPGYSVSWFGGIVGALYGFGAGAVAGYAIATLWNLAHLLYLGIVVAHGDWEP